MGYPNDFDRRHTGYVGGDRVASRMLSIYSHLYGKELMSLLSDKGSSCTIGESCLSHHKGSCPSTIASVSENTLFLALVGVEIWYRNQYMSPGQRLERAFLFNHLLYSRE